MLTATRALADYFEACGARGRSGQNGGELDFRSSCLRRLNDAGKAIEECPVPPAALAELLGEIESGEITAASGKKVFATMFETGQSAREIIAAEGLAQITDTGAIEKIAREVMAKSPDNVAKYRSGNEGVFKFFVGQVMRETRGQANPQLVNEIVKRVLGES